MSKMHLIRAAGLEAALRRVVEAAPRLPPTEGSYDDVQSAYANGVDVGAWDVSRHAAAVLADPKPANAEELVELAIAKLREARDLLAAADAPRSLERVRAALKSAEGAGRNAGYRRVRADLADNHLQTRVTEARPVSRLA
ncbi:hypothetical protein [Rubrivivax gelatinosus]|uniref:hypothetical protein n=1 Tax=Rubrivivax gelatinosus TaxID=28068 RepID=UPI0005C2528F|nr:hypothetical protein [Rubrivivax gelatinosus]MBG6083048.1 hypothetical protein [Rubrivivax gelatinosus]